MPCLARHTNHQEHDSGDFFSAGYLQAWLRIIRATPETRFYCYTKEVPSFRRYVEPDPPPNFNWVYSLGGRWDSLLDTSADRVADVFATEADLVAAGYHSQAANDLLAVDGPAPVGIVANRIPTARARQAGRRLSDWQAGVDAARRKRLDRHRVPATSPTANNAVEASAIDHADTSAAPPSCGSLQVDEDLTRN